MIERALMLLLLALAALNLAIAYGIATRSFPGPDSETADASAARLPPALPAPGQVARVLILIPIGAIQ